MKSTWYAVVYYLDDVWFGLVCNLKRLWWAICWQAFGYKVDVCTLSGCSLCPHKVLDCCEQCHKWDNLENWEEFT